MPPRGRRASRVTTTPAWLQRLLVTFAAIAVLLWLLPLFAPHTFNILFPGGPNFEDIIVYKGRFTVYHTAKFFRPGHFSAFAYPAGAAPIYEAFYTTSDPVQTYLLLAAVTIAIGLLVAWLILRKTPQPANLFLPLLTLSFPLVFLIQRANIEIVLWILIALGILAFLRNLRIPAAILFGLAAAIKFYPIFLLGLFLTPADRRSRQDFPAFITGLLTAIFAIILATAYAGPTIPIATHGFFTGVGRFQDHYAQTVRSAELRFDHCLFSPVKYWSHQTHASLAPYMTPYYLAAGAFALLLFLRVRTLPFLNRLLFLIAAMVCLPPVSYNYTLVHLYLPLVLMLAAFATNPTPAAGKFALALVLFLMLPLEGLAAIYPLPAGPTQSFALLLLLPIIALQPWPETEPDGAA